MIAKRVFIGLLITLFLPAPRGNDISIFLKLPGIILNLFEIRPNEIAGVVSSENQTDDAVKYKVAHETGCPIDLFNGLLEKEVEKELEEESNESDINSKKLVDCKSLEIPYLFSLLQIQQVSTEKFRVILLSHVTHCIIHYNMDCVIRC